MNYLSYLTTTVLVFLTIGAATYVVFSLKVSFPRCLCVFCANLMLAFTFMYFSLKLTSDTRQLDMLFLVSCLSFLITAQICFKESLASKLVFITVVYICEGIVSLSLYLLLPSGFGLIAAVLTQVIAASLVFLALYFKQQLNHAINILHPKTLAPFIAYALFTLLVLQYQRRKIISLDLFLAYFIILLSAIIFILMIIALFKSTLHSIAKNEKELLATLEEAERRNYQLLLSSIENLRIANHDARHHTRTVMGFLKQGKNDEALKYLAILEHDSGKNMLPIACMHPAADAIIKYYAELCKVGGIAFEHHLAINADMSISDTDLCSCLSNCLENAIIATLKLDNADKKIRIVAFERQNNLIIKIENTFNDMRQSFKEGIGSASLKRIAAKYDGSFTTEVADNLFTACLILKLY